MRQVSEEIFAFYGAIFQRPHSAAVGAAAPVDSGAAFVPDEFLFPIFVTGLPQLSANQQSFFSYEFYRTTRPLVGPALLATLNGMLAVGCIPSSRGRSPSG
jgi:hypothetical protein